MLWFVIQGKSAGTIVSLLIDDIATCVYMYTDEPLTSSETLIATFTAITTLSRGSDSNVNQQSQA